MRIFIGTAEIAGYYVRLQAGLAVHGVESVRVELVEHPFSYGPGDRHGLVLRAIGWTARRRNAAAGRPLPVRLAWRLAQAPLRPVLLAWAIARCDAFILVFGTSVAGPWELPLLRLIGKPVVHVFHGSDTRPPYLDGFVVQSGSDPRRLRRLTRRTRRRIAWIERWSTTIMSHPASAQLHRRPFVAGLNVGIPIWSIDAATALSSAGHRPAQPAAGSYPVRLLHSPSNPGVKGTARIREVVAELARKGLPVELVEISGRPNVEVRDALHSCDLVIDQLYSDQPLAGFASEAAVEGVGAVVGSYAAGNPGAPLIDLELPSAFVQPDDLGATIERLVRDPAAREALGERSRAFVLGHWQPEQVAERFLRMIRGDSPASWFVDPATVTYHLGCGLSEEMTREIVSELVGRYGPSVLGVDDKPELLARLLALIEEPARLRR